MFIRNDLYLQGLGKKTSITEQLCYNRDDNKATHKKNKKKINIKGLIWKNSNNNVIVDIDKELSLMIDYVLKLGMVIEIILLILLQKFLLKD